MQQYIIGIGASAGGHQALEAFFSARQTTAGETYVIIVHSVRTYQSKLVDILSKLTDIEILWIDEGVTVLPDKVYVARTSHKVEISDGKFHLVPRESSELTNFTINYFFESLARAAKEKAIGIIMSGTGTDGTNGSKAIEDNAGIVIVQNPNTAQFDGMPLTSIRYDHPDYILAPEEMPGLIDLIITGNEDKAKRKFRSLTEFY